MSIVWRFRQVPPFARNTIRKFTYNVSDLRKLAARDYEDILQVRNVLLESSECKLNSNLRPQVLHTVLRRTVA